MSGEDGDHGLFDDNGGFFFNDDLSSIFARRPNYGGGMPQDLQGLNPLSMPTMSFTDYLHGSVNYGALEQAFDISCPPLPDVSGPFDGEKSVSDMVVESRTGRGVDDIGVGRGVDDIGVAALGGFRGTPITPNSSVSSSSAEAVGEEDSGPCKKHQMKPEEEVLQQTPKRGDDVFDSSKKLSKPRKKGEKRKREPSFAFMTKSEVDHLEDGYRWRKYGQKAVKNSPYPRSYYRCTTQKCSVKKKIERSYQDPSIVITTYEGQHTHHSPATIRGGSHMLPPLQSTPSSFLQYPIMHQLHPLNYNNGQQRAMNPGMYLQNLATPLQQLQLPDYGLLQDIVPSFTNNNQT